MDYTKRLNDIPELVERTIRDVKESKMTSKEAVENLSYKIGHMLPEEIWSVSFTLEELMPYFSKEATEKINKMSEEEKDELLPKLADIMGKRFDGGFMSDAGVVIKTAVSEAERMYLS